MLQIAFIYQLKFTKIEYLWISSVYQKILLRSSTWSLFKNPQLGGMGIPSVCISNSSSEIYQLTFCFSASLTKTGDHMEFCQPTNLSRIVFIASLVPIRLGLTSCL